MPSFVCEIGINHNGNPVTALEIATAVRGYATAIKLQHMIPRLRMTPEAYAGPHPVPENAFADTYGAHKEKLYFAIEKHEWLRDNIRAMGMQVAWSVWDHQSAGDVIGLKPDYIKIPSALCVDIDLLDIVAASGYPMHISYGMTTLAERQTLYKKMARREHTIFYDSTSNYTGDGPVYMTRLGDPKRPAGFSCHHPSIGFGLKAAWQGFQWIEYHVTMDKSQRGTDHPISLTPDEFNLMVETWSRTERNTSEKRPVGIAPHEVAGHRKLRK